jgi:DNA-directed RNA polymerase specialized sigma24 family protein
MEALEEAARLLPRQRDSINNDDAVQEGFLRMARRGMQRLANPGGYWYTTSRRVQIERHRRPGSKPRPLSDGLRSNERRNPKGNSPTSCSTS